MLRILSKKYFFMLLVILVTLAGVYRFSPESVSAFGQALYTRVRIFSLILEKIELFYIKPVDTEQLMHDAIQGLLANLDPHTVYLTREQFKKWSESYEGYDGIGATYAVIDSVVTIISIDEDGPAQKMGLRIGDRIIAIEGRSIIGIKEDHIPEKLRGPAGTRVSVLVERPGLTKPITFNIRREKIQEESIPYAFIVSADIGYIQIARFNSTTPHELDVSFAQLRTEGMAKLVIDLRNNTGGDFDAAIAVADRFITGGRLITFTKGRSFSANQRFFSTQAATLPALPLIILINGISASSSEIVAGAIQDWDRGLIAGETSFGKAMVQSEYVFQDGSALLLTTASYYTPLGRLIQREDNLNQNQNLDEQNNSFNPDLPKPGKEQPKIYKTGRGRIVYGGGGISPDIIIKAKEQEDLESFYRLYFAGPRFFFVFAEQFAVSNPEWRANFDRFTKEFNVTESLFNEFVTMVKKSKFTYPAELFNAHEEKIKVSIKKEIANYFWGKEARFQIALTEDTQFQQSLAYFNEAKQLLDNKDN